MAKKALRPGDILLLTEGMHSTRAAVICTLPQQTDKGLYIHYRDLEGGGGGGATNLVGKHKRVGRVDARYLKKLCKY